MLRLPMHPRYSRMLVEAAQNHCVPAAALCAALVSGRDLLMRVSRDESHISEARELFEASQESDFFTLMRAWQFARKNHFSIETCRRYGIHAQTARQVEQTYEQILEVARRQRLITEPKAENPGAETDGDKKSAANRQTDDALLRCITAGFIDQLCVRRDKGTLECELTEGRQGTLVRESVVQNATLFVTASIRQVESRGYGNLTLLALATAVKPEWLAQMFPQHLTSQVEHLFDRTQKRVAAVKLVRFQDLVVQHEHQRDVEPEPSGRCLATAYTKGWFELPLLNHEIKQFIARVNLVHAAMPELEYPPFDEAAIVACLTRAFAGMTLVKEAQATHLKEAFSAHLAPEQVGWLNELTPLSIPWLGDKKLKLTYAETTDLARGGAESPEAQVKLQECFQLQHHPMICEGTMPVKLWLCTPDGKRLEATVDWPRFKANLYPKHKAALVKKFPSLVWP
jgi:ATP-dependent helicase HrpB